MRLGILAVKRVTDPLYEYDAHLTDRVTTCEKGLVNSTKFLETFLWP